jgi:hypothetical protein
MFSAGMPIGLDQLDAGDAAAPAPLQTSLVSLMSRSGQVQRVDQAGHGDDRGAVLVVMEDRDVHLSRSGFR